MKYLVTTLEEEIQRYYYEVEADSEEDAKAKVSSGDLDYVRSKFMSGETIDVEVEVME